MGRSMMTDDFIHQTPERQTTGRQKENKIGQERL
jgi:hypothetical protein